MARRINTFICLDLEATGLSGCGERPRITELSLVAVNRDGLLESRLSDCPRVLDKLTLCTYPMKPITPTASDITGLTNDNLLQKKDFDENLAQMLALFIARQDPPVCLVAHYGYGFDYGLLQSELISIGMKLQTDLLCIDSLQMLKELDEEALKKQRREECETPVEALAASAKVRSHMEDKARVMSVKRKLFCDTDEEDIKKPSLEEKDKYTGDNPKEEISQKGKDVETVEKGEKKEDENDNMKETSNDNSQNVATTPSVAESAMSSQSTVVYSLESQTAERFEGPAEIDESSDAVVPEQKRESPMSPTLTKDLSCNEVISEDSNSDQELKGPHTFNVLWSRRDSTTDDMLRSVNLEEAMAAFMEQQEDKTVGKPSEQSQEPSQRVDVAQGQGEGTADATLPQHTTGNLATARANLSAVLGLRKSVPPTQPPQCQLPQKQNAPHTQQAPLPCPETTNISKSMQQPTATTSETQPANPRPVPMIPPSPRVSYKLSEVYKRMFGEYPRESHRAEDDCVALLRVCQKLGVDMVKWADQAATAFADVTPFYVAKKRTPLKAGVFPYHL